MIGRNSDIQAFLCNPNLKKSLKLMFWDVGSNAWYNNYIGYDVDPRHIIYNDSIVSNSLRLEQKLCNGEIDYMGCNTSTMSITLWKTSNTMSSLSESKWEEDTSNSSNSGGSERVPSYGSSSTAVSRDIGIKKGSPVRLYLYSETDEFSEVPLFSGYVDTVTSNYSTGEVTITCYDLMKELERWNIREALANFLEVNEYVSVLDMLTFLEDFFLFGGYYHLKFINKSNLANPSQGIRKDEMFSNTNRIYKALPDKITALDMVRYICQFNGVFGIIDPYGRFDFRILDSKKSYDGLYPNYMNFDKEYNYVYLPYEEFNTNAFGIKHEKEVSCVVIAENESCKPDDWNYTITTDIQSIEYEGDEGIIADMDVGTYVYTCTGVDETGGSTWDGGYDLPGGGVINIIKLGDCKEGNSFTLKKDRIQSAAIYFADGYDTYGDVVLKVIANPFIHGKEYEDKFNCAKYLMENGIAQQYGTYAGYEFKGPGMPFLEVGDCFAVRVRNWFGESSEEYLHFKCLILERSLSGIQRMTDTFKAEIFDMDQCDSDEGYHTICATNGFSMNDTEELSNNNKSGYDNWDIQTASTMPENFEDNTVYFVKTVDDEE